jgi:hypothetical protein
MRFGIFGWLGRDRDLLRASQLCLQGVGYCFCDVALDREDVGQLAIVNFRPEMRISERIDQLHIDADLIVRFLDTAFQDVENSQLLGDIRQILWRALELLRRRARDHFQIRDFGQAG